MRMTRRGVSKGEGKEATFFSEEKEAKRLWRLWHRTWTAFGFQERRFFGSFSEKDRLPAFYASTPASAPLMHVPIVPASTERIPSRAISARRSGTIAPMPPSTMPSEPKLANPHIA